MKKSNLQQNLDIDMSGTKYTRPSRELIKEAVAHYRKTGFPYIELSEVEKEDEFLALKNFRTPLIFGQDVYADSTGVALANFYHKHRYGVVCGENRTALSVFSRDWLLEKVIEKCYKLQGSLSDSKMRSMLSIFEGVQVASNFPPATAKALYDYFLPPEGGSVWDMSCGWGGRLLASLASQSVNVYYGTEPSTETYEGLLRMIGDIRNLPTYMREVQIFIRQTGSEVDLPLTWGPVDLCFTSPPYFAAEKYSREDTQSFLKYPYTSDWMKYFIGSTLKNCRKIVKSSGKVVINIANVKSFPDLEDQFIKRANLEGFDLEEVKFLLYTAMPGAGKKNRQEGEGTKRRSEPIFVLRPR